MKKKYEPPQIKDIGGTFEQATGFTPTASCQKGAGNIGPTCKNGNGNSYGTCSNGNHNTGVACSNGNGH